MRQCRLHARQGLVQALEGDIDLVPRKAAAPHAPIEMLAQRQALGVLEKLLLGHVLPDRHEVGVERGIANRGHRHFLDVLAPGPHARAPERIVRPERHLRKHLVEVLIDHRRFDEHFAVVLQCRHHAVGVELEIPLRQMLVVVELDVMRRPVEALLRQHHAHALRTSRNRGMIELKHRSLRVKVPAWRRPESPPARTACRSC